MADNRYYNRKEERNRPASKITDKIDEARILLGTIPGQAEKYRRVKDEEE